MDEEILTVLIVDDEEGMRLGAARALRDHRPILADAATQVSFVTVLAASAEEATAHLDVGMPDIILLDQKLPGMSGIAFLEAEKERLGGALVIMISAYANIETAVRATRQGAYDFLPKPFTPAELRYVVDKAAGRLVLARRADRLVAEKRRVRFEFIRVLGHELKAPIGAVEGYLEILKNRTLGNDLAAYETLIGRSALRLQGMRRLILDLLDMTRVESGDKARVLEPLDLATLADDCLETYRLQAEERGIILTRTGVAPLPFTGDRGELEMIMNNLVSNAVKYNRDGGRVDLRLDATAGAVVIAVSDTGIGMAAEDRERLFGEFVRIRNERTVGILGTGLGLAILKRLIDLYGGTVTVASEPDVGTTFTVTLPG